MIYSFLTILGSRWYSWPVSLLINVEISRELHFVIYDIIPVLTLFPLCVCVAVCVRVKEKDRQREMCVQSWTHLQFLIRKQRGGGEFKPVDPHYMITKLQSFFPISH